jgi:enoyl reductase
MARVVIFTEYGEPDVLQVVEMPDPAPAADGVRIRTRAAGVQPFDAGYRRGDFDQWKAASFPARLGNEVAGVVDAVGTEATGFAPGDEVIAFVDSVGYADVVVAPASHAVPKPESMTWPEAGVLSASGQTADAALDELGIRPGDRLLIHAAAGGVGSFATQLAVARGAIVVGTASERNHDYLCDLGAIPVTYGPGLQDRVSALVPDGITAALDCIGGEANAVSLALLGSADRAVTVADWGSPVRRIGTDRSAARLAGLTQRYEKGELVIPVSRRFPLEHAALAHREIETGHGQGKIALVIT